MGKAMKVVVISHPGPPEVLVVQERPVPECCGNDVLVRVKAAGVNRADLSQREGRYPAPPGVPADIPGLEVAGVVAACGPEVKAWHVGDPVCALLAGGGYAEYVAVDAGHCLPVPAGWSFSDAAALPEALCTVWHNVFQRGRLQPGEKFLVHGGSSGIGMAALQLARAFGAHAWATAGSEEKCRACREAGAGVAINYRQEDFSAVLQTEGIDVILDMVGGDTVAKNLGILRAEGRLVFINSMKGSRAEFKPLDLMARRLTMTGSTLRGRDRDFKAALIAEVRRQIWPVIADGGFRANVFEVFPFAAAAEAHRLMESSRHIGKIVLCEDDAHP